MSVLILACGARSDLLDDNARDADALDASTAYDVAQDTSDAVNEPLEAADAPDAVVPQFPRARIVQTDSNTCAINASGAARCWGSNTFGAIGNGSTMPGFNTPQQVTGLTSGVEALGIGSFSACAVGATGSLSCWGANGGRFGDGTDANSSTPVLATGINTAVAIGGDGATACVLLSSGAVECMGSDQYGGLALGSITSLNYNTPQVSVVTGAVALSGAGTGDQGVMCAVLGDGSAWCWGYMAYSLGDGMTLQSGAPVTVAGIAGAVQVAATSQNVCVVLNDGVLRCWGNDYLGQVGDGRAGSNVNSTMPTTSTLSDVAFVSVGGEHMCAVTHLGAVKCVGANFSGQLGYGLEDYSPTWLTAIASGAVQVACSGNSTCALMADNAVYCWGDNTDGELGDGTNIQRDTPVLVKGF